MTPLDGGIGFIGSGNMGEALIGGLIKGGVVSVPSDIVASDIRRDCLVTLRGRYSITTCESNSEVLAKAQTVIFAVKPQNMAEVVTEIASAVTKDHLLITICAGISTRFLERRITGEPRIIRVMPNTPALIGWGISALSKGRFATEGDLKVSELIFQSVGQTVHLEECHLDAVTALSGSGPAYFFHLIECLIEAGIQVGIPPEASALLVKQTAAGASLMCRDSEHSPARLREMVTSPKGTTWAALEVMRHHNFSEVINEAIRAATNRAGELGSDE
jgi:pyrroline-5-carboxylate reductase